MSEALLCKTIPLPPGDVDIVLDEPTADMPLTKRQRLERHRTDPTCAGCHAFMDPLADHGLPIDPSGSFDKQPVADARELGEAIGSNDKVAQCLVRKLSWSSTS
ncbi:hypothetical protein BE20_14130 [Sorangium cellulosum]|nr:hypothetical protein BE20_14130 [Sorangium cellulosum]